MFFYYGETVVLRLYKVAGYIGLSSAMLENHLRSGWRSLGLQLCKVLGLPVVHLRFLPIFSGFHGPIFVAWAFLMVDVNLL